MRPLPPRPSISAFATPWPIATSSEPTKVSAGPVMRLMKTATGMPAAAKRARSSAICWSSVGLNTTPAGRAARAWVTSAFCSPTSSGVSGT